MHWSARSRHVPLVSFVGRSKLAAATALVKGNYPRLPKLMR